MPMINIYLPDDLHKEWKENQKKGESERIKTSSLCQSAIRSALDEKKTGDK